MKENFLELRERWATTWHIEANRNRRQTKATTVRFVLKTMPFVLKPRNSKEENSTENDVIVVRFRCHCCGPRALSQTSCRPEISLLFVRAQYVCVSLLVSVCLNWLHKVWTKARKTWANLNSTTNSENFVNNYKTNDNVEAVVDDAVIDAVALRKLPLYVLIQLHAFYFSIILECLSSSYNLIISLEFATFVCISIRLFSVWEGGKGGGGQCGDDRN